MQFPKIEHYIFMTSVQQPKLVTLAACRSPTLSRDAVGGPVQPKTAFQKRRALSDKSLRAPTAGLKVDSLSAIMVRDYLLQLLAAN